MWYYLNRLHNIVWQLTYSGRRGKGVDWKEAGKWDELCLLEEVLLRTPHKHFTCWAWTFSWWIIKTMWTLDTDTGEQCSFQDHSVKTSSNLKYSWTTKVLLTAYDTFSNDEEERISSHLKWFHLLDSSTDF